MLRKDLRTTSLVTRIHKQNTTIVETSAFHNRVFHHYHHLLPWVRSFDLFRHRRVAIKREARLRETNWSSKNGGFVGGLVTLPRKNKVLKSKDATEYLCDKIFSEKNIIFPCHHTDISGTVVSESVTLSATKGHKGRSVTCQQWFYIMTFE